LPNDILVSRLPDPVGRACIIPKTGDKMITAVDCTIIRFNKDIILPEWFVYYSQSDDYYKQIEKRIVATLDKAFAAIDQAIANTEKNLKNVKELFESYLEGVFENGGSGWEEKTLEEVCEFRNGAAHEQHINENGKFILVNSKFISADGEKFKRTDIALSPLFVNDIAFVMSDVPNGKALAKCFLVDKNDTYTLNQRIGAIKSNVFYPEFLVYQFNRNKYLLSFNNGENQTNLRKGDILNCPLWLPSKEEQQKIVLRLDSIQAETKKLYQLYLKKLSDLEELKKTILKRAFAGELK
jgi:type I restriction enzyme S subunit